MFSYSRFSGLKTRELAPAALGKIHIELLRVERYLQNAFTDIVGDGYAGIRLTTKQGIEHEISLQFLNVEIHRWIVFPIVSDELGQDVGGNGWTHGERQSSAYLPLSSITISEMRSISCNAVSA